MNHELSDETMKAAIELANRVSSVWMQPVAEALSMANNRDHAFLGLAMTLLKFRIESKTGLSKSERDRLRDPVVIFDLAVTLIGAVDTIIDEDLRETNPERN